MRPSRPRFGAGFAGVSAFGGAVFGAAFALLAFALGAFVVTLAFSAFARRDFLRAALLGWMIPFCAALSNWLSTLGETAASPATTAFLYIVFNRVLTSRLRKVRFSEWRTHFSAAFIFGTRGIVTQAGVGV